MRILTIIIATTVFSYLSAGFLLFLFQRNFLYFPSTEVVHPYETEIFAVNNETIIVVAFNKNMADAVVYFGGNGETVARNAPDFTSAFTTHAVYLVNYRGYSGSSGTPSEQGIYADAEAIVEKLSGRHEKLSIIGRSLGSGVAAHVASKRSIHKLILVTPYDSIQHIAQDKFPYYPMSFLLRDKYDSVALAKKIKSPVLVVAAENDNIIPFNYTSRLIAAFPTSQITVEIVEDAGHNTLSNKKQYIQLLQKFVLKTPPTQ